jgi:hypothetical protein
MTDDTNNVIDLAAPYGRKKDGTPKKKRGGVRPGSGFSRTGAAYNGDTKGDGWGGPAKGAGSSVPLGPKPENMRADGAAKEYRERKSEKVRDRQARVAMMEDKLFDLAMGAEREETQINAAAKLHAIYEGTPVQRSITAAVDDVSRLNDHELRAELARLSREASEAGEGDTPPGGAGGSADVVH